VALMSPKLLLPLHRLPASLKPVQVAVFSFRSGFGLWIDAGTLDLGILLKESCSLESTRDR
jgi:hypothetical protein